MHIDADTSNINSKYKSIALKVVAVLRTNTRISSYSTCFIDQYT